jgi:hypothetical protein
MCRDPSGIHCGGGRPIKWLEQRVGFAIELEWLDAAPSNSARSKAGVALTQRPDE